MKVKTNIKLASLLLSVLAATAAFAETKAVKQWSVFSGTTNTPVMPGTYYGLKNICTQRSLEYHRTGTFGGINLGWDSQNKVRNVRFERPPNPPTSGAIKRGESLAIYVKDHGYLRYKKRDIGINLGWSPTPVYEWRLGGVEAGAHLRTSVAVSVHNKVENDHMVYCERPHGINLRWQKDKESEGCHSFWEAALEKAKDKGVDILEDKFGP